jgi:pimeloyl-ACP methyl ester carboxylesterase
MKSRVLERDVSNGKRPHRWRRILGGIAVGLIVLVLLLGVAGFTWNELATRHYRNANPVPGTYYTVDGHQMHMYCTGTGSPTLVLDSGLGDDWTVWLKVQPELSKVTQVCSYDRSGLGSSEELPGGHDANTLADELHALVGQAGIKKPFVLAGHSIAGVYIRAYATKYPTDLAGLIFIDGSSPDQFKRLPKEVTDQTPNLFEMSWMVRLGIARATGQCTEVVPGLEAWSGWIFANTCNPTAVDAGIEEYKDIAQSMDETRHTGPFGHLPILIFSQDPNGSPTDPSTLSPAATTQMRTAWNQMQEELKLLSSDSHRIIAKGSGHYIEVDRADLINREVPVFIEQIRNGTQSPDIGATKTE